MIFYGLFIDIIDKTLDIFYAQLRALIGIGAFSATICKFCNGYYGVSTRATVDIILDGIEREYEKENEYFNFDLERGFDIFNGIFSKINDILLAPYKWCNIYNNK